MTSTRTGMAKDITKHPQTKLRTHPYGPLAYGFAFVDCRSPPPARSTAHEEGIAVRTTIAKEVGDNRAPKEAVVRVRCSSHAPGKTPGVHMPLRRRVYQSSSTHTLGSMRGGRTVRATLATNCQIVQDAFGVQLKTVQIVYRRIRSFYYP